MIVEGQQGHVLCQHSI